MGRSWDSPLVCRTASILRELSAQWETCRGESLEEKKGQEKTFISTNQHKYHTPSEKSLSPFLCNKKNEMSCAHMPGGQCQWNIARVWRLGGELLGAQVKRPRPSGDTVPRCLVRLMKRQRVPEKVTQRGTTETTPRTLHPGHCCPLQARVAGSSTQGHQGWVIFL